MSFQGSSQELPCASRPHQVRMSTDTEYIPLHYIRAWVRSIALYGKVRAGRQTQLRT